MKNLTYFLLSGSMLLSLSACKKQIQIDPPVTSVASTTVFANDNAAIAAQLNLYATIPSDPYTYHIFSAMSSDEYTYQSSNATWLNIYRNSLSGIGPNAADIGLWTKTYNYLYRANAILEGLNNSNSVSTIVKQQTQGEALFMRAYFNFYLTNFYGNIPIVNSTDYKTNSQLGRSPQADVYAQIIKDLQQAQRLLSSNYLDATDLNTTTDRIRPTKWAATALLARTYLFNKNWAGADSAASVLIGNPTYQLSPLSGTNSVFMKNSSEAIWQITNDLAQSQYATVEGLKLILTTTSSFSGGANCWTLSPQILAAFENNDQRKVNWVGTLVSGATTYYFPYKYKDGATASSLREYTMMLRLGEQYLIRAEARVYENNPSGAVADLNIIRRRAGLPDYAGNVDNASLLTAILHERQIELYGEGHRWFDLRRTGTLNAVMGAPGNATIIKGGSAWSSYQQYYPILQSDINLSPNLTQTPGY